MGGRTGSGFLERIDDRLWIDKDPFRVPPKTGHSRQVFLERVVAVSWSPIISNGRIRRLSGELIPNAGKRNDWINEPSLEPLLNQTTIALQTRTDDVLATMLLSGS